jgi:hypothetical protein
MKDSISTHLISKILIVSVLFSLILPLTIAVKAQTDRQVTSQSFLATSNVSKAYASTQMDVQTFSVLPKTIVSAPSSNSIVSPAIGSYSYTVTNATSSFLRDTISGRVVDIVNPPATSPLTAPSKQVIQGNIVE